MPRLISGGAPFGGASRPSRKLKKEGRALDHFVIVSLVAALIVSASFLLYVTFSQSHSNFTVEILAAIPGVVLVVSSVGATIHFQNRAETERAYRDALFEKKLVMHQDLLNCIALADNDNVVLTDKSIKDIRNRSRVAALVAGVELVTALSKFINRITRERSVSFEKEEGDTVREIVQVMREDLQAVQGDVKQWVKALVDQPEAGKEAQG